jgi:hypothetical protein
LRNFASQEAEKREVANRNVEISMWVSAPSGLDRGSFRLNLDCGPRDLADPKGGLVRRRILVGMGKVR